MSDLTRAAEQLLADAGLDTPPPAPAVTAAVQQSDDRQIAILADLDDGTLDVPSIARKHGVSVRSVYRIAARAEQLTEAARKYLATKNFRAIDAWVRAAETGAGKGRHEAARDLLLHSGVIDPVADSNGHGRTNIAIVIGEPGRPVSVTPSHDKS